MNKEIQPEMKNAKVICACEAEYNTLSVKEEMKVDICSNCHPFYTGNTKSTARGGRAEKFKEKYGM